MRTVELAGGFDIPHVLSSDSHLCLCDHRQDSEYETNPLLNSLPQEDKYAPSIQRMRLTLYSIVCHRKTNMLPELSSTVCSVTEIVSPSLSLELTTSIFKFKTIFQKTLDEISSLISLSGVLCDKTTLKDCAFL